MKSKVLKNNGYVRIYRLAAAWKMSRTRTRTLVYA